LRDLVNELVRILKKFKIRDVFLIESNYDPQYAALTYLYNHVNKQENFLLIIILNAIISYQLTGTGEQYWWEFSQYFSRNSVGVDIIGSLIEFLKSSRFNARLREVKISRLLKLRNFSCSFHTKITDYINSPIILVKDLARNLNSKENAKTIVFATKMFHYGCRIANLTNKPLPYEIPIPVDTRIKYLSTKLGIQRNIQEFWNKIAQKVKIPPLHLDSLLWVSLGCIKRIEKVDDIKLQELISFLEKIVSN